MIIFSIRCLVSILCLIYVKYASCCDGVVSSPNFIYLSYSESRSYVALFYLVLFHFIFFLISIQSIPKCELGITEFCFCDVKIGGKPVGLKSSLSLL